MASKKNKGQGEAPVGSGLRPPPPRPPSPAPRPPAPPPPPIDRKGLPASHLLNALLPPVKALLADDKALELQLDLVIDPLRFVEVKTRQAALAQLVEALESIDQWATKVGVCEVHTGPDKTPPPPPPPPPPRR